MRGAPAAAQPQPEPEPPGARVTVCAWCVRAGRSAGAVRGLGDGAWVDVSHAAVRALVAAGFASRAICPACRPTVPREWGSAT